MGKSLCEINFLFAFIISTTVVLAGKVEESLTPHPPHPPHPQKKKYSLDFFFFF